MGSEDGAVPHTRTDWATGPTLHHAVLRVRDTAGPYRLERVIGTGGMGVVHLGAAPDGRAVAVKTLRPDMLDKRAAERFAREAQVRIDHPNVVQVLDAGTDGDGTPYIVFELLDGETFEDRMRDGVTVDEALGVIAQACEGVAAAHDAGVVHRDLKPANLFIVKDGTVKVLDFGIAQLAGGAKMTATGGLVGTPAYLAPEQARATQDVDARADVWALGAVLYEALSGAPPFEGESFFATVLSILMEPVPPLAPKAPHVPQRVGELVQRCLAKDRDARFPNARALGEALARVRADDPGPAVVARPTHRMSRGSTAIPLGEERVVVILLAEGVTDHAELERVVAEHGGDVATRFGESALGLFGGSRWVGNEAVHAVSAALAARSLAERIAVASGRASASSGGLAGAAVSQAERGCRADLAGVAVDGETARRVQARFTVERIDDEVLEVVEERPPSWVAPRAPDADVVVGRDVQVGTMRFALQTALTESRAMVIAVTGPAGIGKSALGRELEKLIAEESVPTRAFIARAEPLYQQTPWSYVGSLLRRHAVVGSAREGWPRLDPGAPHEERCDAVVRLATEAIDDPGAALEAAEFLGEILGVAMPESVRLRAARAEPRLMADRIRLAVSDFLAGHASQAAVALLLENVDWADETSLEVLETVVDDLSDTPLVVFASSRKQELAPGRSLFAGLDTVHVKLGGLPKGAVAEVAARVAGHELPPAVVDALAERTEGNPLFVQEIVLALAEHGPITEERLGPHPLPLSIEAAVQSRLDLLTVEERELVKRASIFGRPFSVQDLAATGTERAEEVLSALRRRDIVARQVGGRARRQYDFRSPLVGEVAYRMIEKDARASLHRRVAMHLATSDDSDPGEVARHLELGESPDAARWFCTAALADAKRGDSASVLRSSERSLDLGAPPEQLWALRMARAEALRFLLRREAQHNELREALAVAATDEERAQTRRQLTFWFQRSGKLAEAIEVGTQAVADADASGDPIVRALARSTLAQACVFSGASERADALLGEAEALSADAGPAVRAQIAETQALSATVQGDVGRTRDACAVAVELFREAGNVREAASSEQNLADAYNRIGAWGEAQRALKDALEGCHRVKNRVGEAYALANLGYACANAGTADAALGHLDSAAKLAREMGDARLGAAVQVYRARMHFVNGAHERLTSEAEDAAAAASAAGLVSFEPVALALAARGYLALGQVERALDLSERALSQRDALGGVEEDEADVFLARAEALDAFGRTEDASAVRARGFARLHEVASKISDTEWRMRFLRDVSANRQLAEATSKA